MQERRLARFVRAIDDIQALAHPLELQSAPDAVAFDFQGKKFHGRWYHTTNGFSHEPADSDTFYLILLFVRTGDIWVYGRKMKDKGNCRTTHPSNSELNIIHRGGVAGQQAKAI